MQTSLEHRIVLQRFCQVVCPNLILVLSEIGMFDRWKLKTRYIRPPDMAEGQISPGVKMYDLAPGHLKGEEQILSFSSRPNSTQEL